MFWTYAFEPPAPFKALLRVTGLGILEKTTLKYDKINIGHKGDGIVYTKILQIKISSRVLTLNLVVLGNDRTEGTFRRR